VAGRSSWTSSSAWLSLCLGVALRRIKIPATPHTDDTATGFYGFTLGCFFFLGATFPITPFFNDYRKLLF
jgi:hypothetical protein